jgi:hypothetical protein
MPRNSRITPAMLQISDAELWAALVKPWHSASALPELQAAQRQRLAQHWQERRAAIMAESQLLRPTAEVIMTKYATVHWPSQGLSREMQSFTWIFPVLQRLLATGDPACHAFIVQSLDSFYAQRQDYEAKPRYEGPLFSPLAISFRVPAYSDCYLALLHHPLGCPAATATGVLKMLLGMGRYLYQRLLPFRIHNVHTSGCTGLFTMARWFPEFSESRAWDRRASHFLLRTLRESFFSDGGHKERVWGYGFYTLDRLQEVYKLAQKTGGFGGHDREFRRRLRQAFRWFAKSIGPEDLKPAYGDCELFTGKPFLDSGQWLFPEFPAGDYGVDRQRSHCLKASGFAIMRNGHHATSSYANCTFGRFAGWHSHHDLLSLNFWAYERPLIEELNRFGSYGNPLDLLCRAPSSHNQLLIDEIHYDARGPAVSDVHWHSDTACDYFSAQHRCYRWLPNRDGCGYIISMDALVRRTIVFVKDPGYLLVLDSVMDEDSPTAFNRAITSHWHSPFGFSALGPQLARTNGSPGCLIALARPDGLRPFIIGLDHANEPESANEHYRERHHLRIRRWFKNAVGPCTGFATVLYPFAQTPPTLDFTVFALAGGAPFRAEGFTLRGPHGQHQFRLNPERLPGVSHAGQALTARAQITLGKQAPITII